MDKEYKNKKKRKLLCHLVGADSQRPRSVFTLAILPDVQLPVFTLHPLRRIRPVRSVRVGSVVSSVNTSGREVYPTRTVR